MHEATERGETWVYLLITLGHVASDREDYGRAIELLEESLALSREMGHGLGLAGSVMSLATVSYQRGDLKRANELYEESLDLARDTGMQPILLTALEGYACVAGARGEARRAAQLSGAAQALQEAKGRPRDTDWLAEADASIYAVRAELGEEAWEEAWRKGRKMTLEEAASCALEDAASG